MVFTTVVIKNSAILLRSKNDGNIMKMGIKPPEYSMVSQKQFLGLDATNCLSVLILLF